MSIYYTVHQDMTSIMGQPHPFPALPPVGGETLAADAASAAIKGPCVIRISADAEHLIDIQADSGELAPAASALHMAADSAQCFLLASGSWYIMAGTIA